MKRIVIGLTPQGDANKGYTISPDFIRELTALGAIPLVLPSTLDDALMADAISLCDGIIFTGGPDVRPSLFDEEIIPSCGAINDERDAFEIKLYKMAINADKSILGICRGVQVMNIAAGGNIYQDIYSQSGTKLVHHTLDGARAFHSVRLIDERVRGKVGFSATELTVNSYHHQSVKDIADGYEVAAVSNDGLVEAIYMPEKPFVVGVQWHPEKRFEGDRDSFCVLVDFVESCKK